jgi:DNA-binding transcriptional LysR family regulator
MPFRYDCCVELRHLRYFVCVAEHLNFTKAAGKLHLAQPALSRQIRDLEKELGVPLFERSSRFVRLTDAGAIFISEARAVLQRTDEAVNAAKAFSTGERGEIHLGYSPSPTVELLPQALNAFQKTTPGVRVTLHDLSTEEMFEGLRESRLDAVLMASGSTTGMRGVTFEKIRTYPACIAVHRNHHLTHAHRLSLAKLVDEPLVAYSRNEYPLYHAWLAELFQSLDRVPEIVEEADSSTSLIAAVEADKGIAVVPSCFGSLVGSRLTLREIQPGLPPLAVGIGYLRRHLSPAARRFVEAVRILATQ